MAGELLEAGMEETKREQQRQELLKLAAQGNLTPDAVVVLAINEDNPLHSAFPWIDSEAAHAHRLNVARHLISSFKITITVHHEPLYVSEFIRDVRKDSNEQGYIAFSVIQSDAQLAKKTMLAHFKLAASSVQKVRELAAALGLTEDFDEQLSELQEDLSDLQSVVAGTDATAA